MSEYADIMKKTTGKGVQFAQRTVHCHNCVEKHLSYNGWNTSTHLVEDEKVLELPKAGFAQTTKWKSNRFLVAQHEAQKKG